MLNYPLLYAEHLSDRDIELIARCSKVPGGASEVRERLRRQPEAVDELLSSDTLFDEIFGNGEASTQIGMTPFLVFGVLVNKVAGDLSETEFVPEWVGAGQRLPVFDVETLREFVSDGLRRYFMIEFLASFTKIASGAVWVQTSRGYRRRRFSELDPVSLAEMVDSMPPGRRAGGYRRLGDVSLFLSGVFPDHTTRIDLGEVTRLRLARSAGVDQTDAVSDEDVVRFYEIVGPGWYGRAIDSAYSGAGVGPEYLRSVAERFTEARRLLNFLSDRYLHRFDTGLMNPVG